MRRSVARRGLLALGPLLGAVATGAVLYGLDVGGGAVPGAVIWIHSGISLLALLLVVYKVVDIGMRPRIRRAFSRQRLPELVSVILGVLSVPLLATGIGAPVRSEHELVLRVLAPGISRVVDGVARLAPAPLRGRVAASGAAPAAGPGAGPAAPARVVPAVNARGDRIQWRTSGD